MTAASLPGRRVGTLVWFLLLSRRMAKAELTLLNSAFSEFTKASESLITYYNSLETQIRELKRQVQEKNGQLETARQYLHTILDSLPVGVVVIEKGPEPHFINK